MATLARTYIDLIGEVLQKGQVRSTGHRRAYMIRCMNMDKARGVFKDRGRRSIVSAYLHRKNSWVYVFHTILPVFAEGCNRMSARAAGTVQTTYRVPVNWGNLRNERGLVQFSSVEFLTLPSAPPWAGFDDVPCAPKKGCDHILSLMFKFYSVSQAAATGKVTFKHT